MKIISSGVTYSWQIEHCGSWYLNPDPLAPQTALIAVNTALAIVAPYGLINLCSAKLKAFTQA
ncbi:MAG: hypothetical protein RMY90_10675 [Planktomarina sp.]|jgi:hypothetical protein|nr:hypothetical protein [Planktomarina sp.]